MNGRGYTAFEKTVLRKAAKSFDLMLEPQKACDAIGIRDKKLVLLEVSETRRISAKKSSLRKLCKQAGVEYLVIPNERELLPPRRVKNYVSVSPRRLRKSGNSIYAPVKFGNPGDIVYRIESKNMAIIMSEPVIEETNEDFVHEVRELLDIASGVREARQLAAIAPAVLE